MGLATWEIESKIEAQRLQELQDEADESEPDEEPDEEVKPNQK